MEVGSRTSAHGAPEHKTQRGSMARLTGGGSKGRAMTSFKETPRSFKGCRGLSWGGGGLHLKSGQKGQN
jgi:hypothetical protein